jgi:hypothetical protein
MHLKPTAGCQISTLIIEKIIVKEDLYEYSMKNINDLGKTFNSNRKWARTLPFLIYFSWDIYRDPLSIIVFQISKLIFDTPVWA